MSRVPVIKPLLIAIAAAACLLFTPFGCGNNPFPTGGPDNPILFLSLGDDPKTLDPDIAYDITSQEIVCPIYPSFFQYNYLKQNPFTLELNLGAEEPERSPYLYTVQRDGRTVQAAGEVWTFHIKHGLRFQDDPCFPGGKGREITAADFAYCFKRMGDPAVPCPIVSFFDSKIKGMQAYEEHTRQLEAARRAPDYDYPIDGVELESAEPYTFRIRLLTPYPQLRFIMAMAFTSPLAHEAVARYGTELARHPVGCGPYVLATYQRKGVIVLKANPNYQPEYYPTEGDPGDREAGLLRDAGKRLPLVKEVHFDIIREGITNWNLFMQGYRDISGVSQTNYEQVMGQSGTLSKEMRDRGVGLVRAVSVDTTYLGFNMTDPLVGGYSEKNRKLRQAISLALDSQQYIDLINQGLGKPAQSILAPGLFGYDPTYSNPYRKPNVAKAKRLLAEAGYPNGIDPETGERLTVNFDNALMNAAGRTAGGLFVKQIEAIGIHVESRTTTLAVFLDKTRTGQFQMMFADWGADYPDPENFVFLLYGGNRRPGPNSCDYENPAYDRLFEKMQAMADGPERKRLIEQMRDIAIEDCPWIYHTHPESFALTQPWLLNYKPHAVELDTIKYMNVDEPLREKRQHEWNRPNPWPAIGFVLFLIIGTLPAASVVRRRTNRFVRRRK